MSTPNTQDLNEAKEFLGKLSEGFDSVVKNIENLKNTFEDRIVKTIDSLSVKSDLDFNARLATARAGISMFLNLFESPPGDFERSKYEEQVLPAIDFLTKVINEKLQEVQA